MGVHFAKDVGIHDLILEGDSLIVFRALSGLSSTPPSVDPMVIGLQTSFREFQQIIFSHVWRQGNKLAHLLAKYAKGIEDFCTWVEENPCFLEQALTYDVISSNVS